MWVQNPNRLCGGLPNLPSEVSPVEEVGYRTILSLELRANVSRNKDLRGDRQGGSPAG